LVHDGNVMKRAGGRSVLTLALVLLLTLLLAVAPSMAAAGQFTVGSGKSYASGRDWVEFAFSAHNLPNGKTSGHITLNWPPAAAAPELGPGQILAHVTCLEVDALGATAYGVIDKADNADASGDWVGINVSDGDPDGFIAFFGYGEPPCVRDGTWPYPIAEGDIEVHQ
jgi:hypothetical protein